MLFIPIGVAAQAEPADWVGCYQIAPAGADETWSLGVPATLELRPDSVAQRQSPPRGEGPYPHHVEANSRPLLLRLAVLHGRAVADATEGTWYAMLSVAVALHGYERGFVALSRSEEKVLTGEHMAPNGDRSPLFVEPVTCPTQ